MKLLLPFLVCTLSLLGKEKVEIISNNPIDLNYFRSFLNDYEVVESNCDSFGPPFKKKHDIIHKMQRRWGFDFQRHIDVNSHKIVWMNIPLFFYRDHFVAKLPKEKMVLFMWEPYIRLRKMYNKNLHACFSRIYTWDDDLVDNKTYFKFYYPVLRPMIDDVVPFEEKKFCTLVSGYAFGSDKYPRKYPNELYSHRMKAIEFFEKIGETGFEFYGKDWPKNRSSYRGSCSDKIGTIKNYRFSICYENCQGVNGYITEKIFDCFAAGNIPVYWGAGNITDYIPKDCFIDKRDFATLDDLYLFLKQMTSEEYAGYLQRIRAYLKSEKAQLFSQEQFQKILRAAIID
jgi:hypothetical protein